MTFAVNKPQKFGHSFSATYWTKYMLNVISLSLFETWNVQGSQISKQKNKSDFKAKSMAELKEQGVLVVEIPASAAKMV